MFVIFNYIYHPLSNLMLSRRNCLLVSHDLLYMHVHGPINMLTLFAFNLCMYVLHSGI